MSQRRANYWMLAAIILLAAATTFALARQQHVINRLDDLVHTEQTLARRECELALQNRLAILRNVRALRASPVLDQATKDALATEDTTVAKLIRELNGCKQ